MTLSRTPILTGGVRFAPSPTGRFHLGNLRTAWISHEIARARGLRWVVRMEDIDKPRVLSWAAESQLSDMRALGLAPDELLFQSAFEGRHWDFFVQAVRAGQVYACDCSRKDVRAAIASAPHSAEILYSGRCRTLNRDRELNASETIAWRFKMPAESGADDFIVARSGLIENGLPGRLSFVPAYQWACAIDDYDGAYELIVRSSDLRPAARLQNAIHEWLRTIDPHPRTLPIPVFHTALVTDNSGHRLEKRTAWVTLPELLEKASIEEIVGKLRSSFDLSSALAQDSEGEVPLTMTLSDLGFG